MEESDKEEDKKEDKMEESDKEDKIEKINVQASLKQLMSEGLKDEVLRFYEQKSGAEVDWELINKTFSVYSDNKD